MMKNKKFVIAIYVPNSLVKTAGGAFSYVEVLTDFLLNVNDDELCFKVVTEGNKKEHDLSSNQIVIDYDEIRYSFKQMVLLKLLSLVSFSRRNKKVQSIKSNKKTSFIRTTLKANNIDIIYYPDQHSALTDQYPFVINNWDLAHITVPPLPDTLRDIDIREHWYNQVAMRAISIFAESETGKTEIQNFLRIPKERIKVLPIFAGKVVDLSVSVQEQATILKKLELNTDDYFFYPAQFWALKNHYHLLAAISLMDLKDRDSFKIVFCGSDKKNMDYIKKIVSDFNLLDRVVFLGFISNEELYTLYKNCLALVFPSLLGPTNMPILEAMELGTPVVCSNFEGHKEMLPDYSGMFDPLNSDEMATLFERLVFDTDYTEELKKRLAEIKTETKFNSKNSFSLILGYFKEIKKFRSLWE